EADRLPPALLGRWKGARTLHAAEMGAATDPARPSIRIVPHAVVRNGPFVRVGVVYHGTIPRGGTMEPNYYMGSVMLWLLEIDGRWTVVGGGDSIT
ncbi:MAG TPA: hypothetical protein VK420_04420, partial [Longimicrobium sp.]|nr:hypothetical protein [Longimicrobium sp.]